MATLAELTLEEHKLCRRGGEIIAATRFPAETSCQILVGTRGRVTPCLGPTFVSSTHPSFIVQSGHGVQRLPSERDKWEVTAISTRHVAIQAEIARRGSCSRFHNQEFVPFLLLWNVQISLCISMPT